MIGIACRYHLLFSSYGRCLYCVAFFSSRDTLLFCVVCRRNRPKEAKSPRTRPWRLNWKRRELIEVCGGAGTALTLETKLPLPHRPLRCRQVEDDQQLSSALGRHLRGLALSGAGQPGGSTPTPGGQQGTARVLAAPAAAYHLCGLLAQHPQHLALAPFQRDPIFPRSTRASCQSTCRCSDWLATVGCVPRGLGRVSTMPTN